MIYCKNLCKCHSVPYPQYYHNKILTTNKMENVAKGVGGWLLESQGSRLVKFTSWTTTPAASDSVGLRCSPGVCMVPDPHLVLRCVPKESAFLKTPSLGCLGEVVLGLI
jgi:hypothetical protein